MSDWKDVQSARHEADALDAGARDTSDATRDEAVVLALAAIRAELRALANLIDFARRYPR